jgi:hypothetical protein
MGGSEGPSGITVLCAHVTYCAQRESAMQALEKSTANCVSHPGIAIGLLKPALASAGPRTSTWVPFYLMIEWCSCPVRRTRESIRSWRNFFAAEQPAGRLSMRPSTERGWCIRIRVRFCYATAAMSRRPCFRGSLARHGRFAVKSRLGSRLAI